MTKKRDSKSEWCYGKFADFGYRMTISRKVILDILSNASGHLSAEDIYMKARPLYPNIGLTTIYRTLDLSSDLGMVRKFDFGDGQARYELTEAPGKIHHHHLVCTGCKRVVDYTDFVEEELRLLHETQKSLSERYGFKITNHTAQFYGLCGECGSKNNKEPSGIHGQRAR